MNLFTELQLSEYDSQGYLILPGFFKKEEIDKLYQVVIEDQAISKNSYDLNDTSGKRTKLALWFTPGKDVLHIMVIGILIAVFSQAGGQNSLFSYAPEIFKNAGMDSNSAFLQSIIVGLINFVFTFVAIMTIDKVGRKKLLMVGSALLFLDAIAIASAFYFQLPGVWVLVFVLGFIAIYSATLGPVTWVALSGIFPNRIRSNGMAAATLALWLANFMTTASFPILKTHLGLPATFSIHAGICILYFLFIRLRIPETKGRSLEEIELLLVKRHS